MNAWQVASSVKRLVFGAFLAARASLAPGLLFCLSAGCLQSAPVEQLIRTNQQGRMIAKQNDVQYIAVGRPAVVASTNQWIGFEDVLRTLEIGRATVRLADWKHVYLRDRSRLEIVRNPGATDAPMLRLHDGELYLSRGGGAVALPVEAAGTRGTPKGTEFLVSVVAGTVTFTMFEGEAELMNASTPQAVAVRSGEQGIAEPGQPIRVHPMVEANHIVQWWLYYPAVIDVDELAFAPGEQTQVAASLEAYRSGHLARALQRHPDFPALREPASEPQRTYFAALALSVGAVDRAEKFIAVADRPDAPLVCALRLMLYAVTNGGSSVPFPMPTGQSAMNRSPSFLLAQSYAHQSTNNLSAALRAARTAVELSTNFGFGWARIGELEFSFGRIRKAREATENALRLAPDNAQAHCVRGFLLAANYQLFESLAAFDRAIELDPFLGNAWLGRGLVKRRMGFRSTRKDRLEEATNSVSWLADLQTAAAVEPRRSAVRAYAGKAFSEAGGGARALQELDYAAQLDPQDPTPPLYKALELHQQNRPNEAVRELERSIALNDNRAVYRSRLLLDQDHATRSAGLAKIYQEAGLEDVALREAARAVSYDYASHSAHQFLAESYNARRDPTRFNLRYETVWFNELLLANILSPVGAGLLSPNISQQEYARLFEHNRLGLTTSTEYRSDGQLREIASHYGLVDRVSYTLDLDYQHNEGTRPNNDLDRTEGTSQVKYQLNDRDSLFLRAKFLAYDSGDNFQYYDSTNARPHYRLSEEQAPLLFAALHREWSPGLHTTLAGGRIASVQTASDRQAPQTIASYNAVGEIIAPLRLFNFDIDYRSRFETWMAELNQVIQLERHTVVLGARGQSGEFDTRAIITHPEAFPSFFLSPPADATAHDDFQRFSGYAYETWRPHQRVHVTVGLTYDDVTFPENHRYPPIAAGTGRETRFSPKAGLVWAPLNALTVRGLYSRSLGGVSFDESFRLEPTQIAGFSQAYRSVIPESVVGSVTVPRHQVAGLAMDFKLPRQTYAGLVLQSLASDLSGPVGVFADRTVFAPPPSVVPARLQRRLQFEEVSAEVSLQRLLGDQWTVGSKYRVARGELRTQYPEVPAGIDSAADRRTGADLHQFRLFAQWTHPTGLFGGLESTSYWQFNHGDTPNPSGDPFTQLNARAGIRVLRRRAELTVGCLNALDTDYRLNPLTYYPGHPQERVWYGRVRVSF